MAFHEETSRGQVGSFVFFPLTRRPRTPQMEIAREAIVSGRPVRLQCRTHGTSVAAITTTSRLPSRVMLRTALLLSRLNE